MNRLIEVARNSVQSWEIDQMGHMNVQFYVDRAADGLAALAIHLGVGPAYMREHGRRLIASSQHIRFLRERRVGAPFYLRAGVLDGDDYGLTIYQEMVAPTSGHVAATFTMSATLRDIATGAACELPQAVRAKALALNVEPPAHGCPKGLAMAPPRPAMALHEADSMGMLATFQALVQAEQCDGHGYLTLRHFMGIFSNGMPTLLLETGVRDSNRMSNVGGAALEYRFIYRRYPQTGDVLTLRSGFNQIGDKTFTHCHWLFDLETGAAVASAEAVGITLDLAARKAMPMPEAMRANLQSALIEGLVV